MDNTGRNKKHLVSVCLPTYEMHGMGDVFLKHNLDVLARQTFKDFDVVISDYAPTDIIKKVCDQYADRLDIRYFRNTHTHFTPYERNSANTNNAIQHATGTILKILCLDDFLYSDKSLEEIVEHFDVSKDTWMVTGYLHSKDGIHFYDQIHPKYHDKIHLGENTIGATSGLTILNENHLLFDTNLLWFLDCDYYKRCHDAFGPPKIFDKPNVVIGIGSHQTSSLKKRKMLIEKDYQYTVKKYGEKSPLIRKIKNMIYSRI